MIVEETLSELKMTHPGKSVNFTSRRQSLGLYITIHVNVFHRVRQPLVTAPVQWTATEYHTAVYIIRISFD